MDVGKPEFKDLVERALQREVAARRELRPHAQLAIAPNSSPNAVEDAYQRLRIRYDAAAFAEYGPVAVKAAEAISELLRVAYEAMKRAQRGDAVEPLTILETKTRGDETCRALQTLRGAIERRLAEALAHREAGRSRDAIRGFESVLVLDRQNVIAQEALRELRAQTPPRPPRSFTRMLAWLFRRDAQTETTGVAGG